MPAASFIMSSSEASPPPLTFLGGSFYSVSMLPPFWQAVSHLNPVLYLVSGFRWSFYGIADVNPAISLAMITVFLVICLGTLGWNLQDRLPAAELINRPNTRHRKTR